MRTKKCYILADKNHPSRIFGAFPRTKAGRIAANEKLVQLSKTQKNIIKKLV